MPALSLFGPLAASTIGMAGSSAGTSWLANSLPYLAGAGVSGLANIAGGILGAGSQSAADNKAWQRQKYLIKYGPLMARHAAERSGFHPLTVLGQAPHAGPVVRSRGDYGLSNAGQAAAAALDRTSSALDLAGKKAQIDLLEKQGNYYQARALSEMRKSRAGDAPGQPISHPSVDAYNPELRYVNKKPVSSGIAEAVSSPYFSAKKKGNQYTFFPSQDIMDIISEPGSPWWLRETVRELKDTGRMLLNTRRGQAIKKSFESYAQRDSPAPPGYRWIWSNWEQAVVLKPISQPSKPKRKSAPVPGSSWQYLR